MGLNVSTDTGVKGTAVTNAAFAADKKLSINGVSVGASTDASAASKAAAINAISGQTGVIATAKTTYGTCGVKVWVFKGEILANDPMAQDRRAAEQAPQR